MGVDDDDDMGEEVEFEAKLRKDPLISLLAPMVGQPMLN